MARRPFRDIFLALLSIALFLGAATAAPPSSGEAAFREARAVVDRGKWRLAEEMVDAALLRFSSPDDDWYWSFHSLRGKVLNGQGRYPEARDWLSPPLPRRLKDSDAAVRRLLELATATWFLNDHATGLQLFREARTLAATKQQQRLPEVLLYIASIVDKPADAERTARKARLLARQANDEVMEISAMNTIGLACVKQGRWVEAVHWFETLLPRARKAQLDKYVQKAEGNLGWAYRELGNTERAAELLADAEAVAARIGAVTDVVRWRIQAGNIRFDREDYEGAKNDYLAAYASAKDPQNQGVLLANLSSTSLQLGRLEDASRYNTQAMVLKKQQEDPEAILNSRLLDARIAALRSQFQTSEELLQDIAERSSVASTRWEAQGWLADVFAQTKRDDLAEERFRLALASAKAARTSIEDDELRLSFNRVFDDVVDRYVSFLVERERPADALAVAEAVRGQSLEEGLHLTVAARPRDPRLVAGKLGSTLLYYRLGRDRSYLWTVTPKAIVATRLPARRVIEAAVNAYQRDLQGRHGSLERIGTRGSELYRMLVGPASGSFPPGSLVIVIPDGGLWMLNFETLVVPSPKQHYWIEDVIVANAVSLQLIGRSAAHTDESPSLLLIGNPPTADPAFPALTRAGAEIDYIARHFEVHRSMLLRGPNATPSAYKSAGPESYDYIHFVAHGDATRTSPLDSAVILGRDAAGDYKLLARDIVGRRLHARLVTISSCHGAGIQSYVGEGLVGLAWAFLRAGADNVVASLWDVSDAATPELMDRMYEGIRMGHAPVSALRDAKLASKGAYRNPRYWAPFIFYIGS
jgi:CHAT domain-containing protein/tetratricopeptide (TPR) repeat protein